MQLTGKAVCVTGGGRGIGKAIALAFAAEGADVCVSARDTGQIDEVAAAVAAMGRKGIAIGCDVSDRSAARAMIDGAAAALGRLDILVNNAGGGLERKPVLGCDPDNWARVVEINLLGTFYCTHAALPHLIAAGGGKIINLGSGMGHSPKPGNSSYNAAKAGVWMFTRCLAQEVWRDGIDVNEIVPGPVYTQLTADVFEPPGRAAPPIADSERVKTPEECVPLALFLAAQPPGGPTGQSFSLARRPI